MKAIDVYDITQCFDSLDEYSDGVLPVDRVLTLFLGLGYQPIDMSEQCLMEEKQQATKKSRTSIRSCMIRNDDDDDDDDASGNGWVLDDVLRVFERHQRFGCTDGESDNCCARTEELRDLFASLLSTKKSDGHDDDASSTTMTASDLVRWCCEVATQEEEAISDSLALSIIRHIAQNPNATSISAAEFVQFYSPPEP
jgi:hypothetical protein